MWNHVCYIIDLRPRKFILSGQPIGLIVANTQTIAQEAARLVKIEYQELPYVLTVEEAIEQSSFFPIDRRIVRGDVEKAMKQADYVFEGRLESVQF
jgi:xanthine dehydrogenase/oxidase